ncbi:g6456 [Coccomyxa elongata]
MWPAQESRPAPRKSTVSRVALGLVRSTYGNGHHELHTSIPETEVEQQIRGAEDSQAGPSDVDEQQEEEEEALTFRPDRIGFIGAGQMGEALICGFIRAGICSPGQLCASVRSEERRQRMLSLGLQVFGDATLGGSAELAAASDIIFLGVKPQYLDGVLEALAPHITPRHLVVSIAAGVRLASLEGRLPEGTRVIRVMPNTPCLIGQAASAYVLGNHATNEDAAKIYMLLSSAGLAVSVEERMMDAVTGLSGSGPAYVFLAIEAMADGAVAAGLPRDKALALAAQTVSGAARMVLEGSGDGSLTHPALLKDRVTSPAGTTIVGLAELEASGLRGALIRAVQAAAKRSETLG